MDKKIFNFIFIVLIFLLLCCSIGNAKRINEYRGLCNQYREQLSTAEALNRDITDRLGRVAEITGRIKETTNTNIADARGIIETVERLRTEVKELEDCIYDSNSIDDYYNYWDNEFGLQ